MIKVFIRKIFEKIKRRTPDYQVLCNVLHDILEIKEKQNEYSLNQLRDCIIQKQEEDHKGDMATLTILRFLRNKSMGEINQDITLNREKLEPNTYHLKAYVTDLETLEIIKEYANDVDEYGDSEGYDFKITIDPDFTKIYVPNCDCGEYEIGDTFTVEGNCIDSNCDTWGTSCGAKAQSLYLFYVKDIDKLAIVQVSYWVV